MIRLKNQAPGASLCPPWERLLDLVNEQQSLASALRLLFQEDALQGGFWRTRANEEPQVRVVAAMNLRNA